METSRGLHSIQIKWFSFKHCADSFMMIEISVKSDSKAASGG